MRTCSVAFSIEADGFPVALRNSNELWIFILKGLKNRFRGSPESVVRSIVMGGHVEIRFVSPQVFQSLFDCERIEIIRGNGHDGEIDFSRLLHGCSFVLGDLPAA